MAITSAPLQSVSAVLNCSTRLREVSAGCKRRAATRNSPKLKPERIRACGGESVPPNSEDLLDVVGIAESLDLNRQWGHVPAWVHGPHRRETDSEQPGDKSGAARITIVQVHQRVNKCGDVPRISESALPCPIRCFPSQKLGRHFMSSMPLSVWLKRRNQTRTLT